MSQQEDEILSRELGKVGGLGANLVSRWLPNDVFKLTIEVTSPLEKTLDAIFIILSQEGEIIQDHRSNPDKPAVCALIRSGFWNANPALIQVQVVSTTDGITKLSLIGTAKEGLIKQHAGEKAARRIADLLARTLGGSYTRG